MDKKMGKNKNFKASILISTIMILSVVMVTVLSTIFVSAIGRSASTNSNESLVAYQRADMGIESTLSSIVSGYGYGGTLNEATIYTTNYWRNVAEKIVCINGIIEKKDSNDEVMYRVQLYKRDTSTPPKLIPVTCAGTANLAFSKIIKIKSVGVLPGKAQRAISADVPIPSEFNL